MNSYSVVTSLQHSEQYRNNYIDQDEISSSGIISLQKSEQYIKNKLTVLNRTITSNKVCYKR